MPQAKRTTSAKTIKGKKSRTAGEREEERELRKKLARRPQT